MASRPSKWRILSVINGVDLPTNGEATTTRAGPLQEFLALPGSEAEVRRAANRVGLLRHIPVLYVLTGTWSHIHHSRRIIVPKYHC